MNPLRILPEVFVHLVVDHHDQLHVAGVFVGIVWSPDELTLVVSLTTLTPQQALEFVAIQTMLAVLPVMGVIILVAIVATGGVLLQQICVPAQTTNQKEI